MSLPFLFFLLILPNAAKNLSLQSETLIENQEYKSSLIPQEQKNIESSYILGPGDVININFEGLPIFSFEKNTNKPINYPINAQGELVLPEIKRFMAKGLTIEELEIALKKEYKPFIINPEIFVSIYSHRPVTIYLGGELKKPGLYTFDSEKLKTFKFPRLFDAIKIASGLTPYSNIEDIVITRENSFSQGGGKIKTSINLLLLLENGDQSQNIRILDGDYIFVKKSSKLISTQLSSTSKTNLNPDTIAVFVNGNVFNPGLTIIPSGSSVYEAIASVGGKRKLSGKINLLRFSSTGKANKRILNINKTGEKGTYNNPVLMNNDIITIDKNILGNITSTLNSVTAPVITSYGIYNIFD